MPVEISRRLINGVWTTGPAGETTAAQGPVSVLDHGAEIAPADATDAFLAAITAAQTDSGGMDVYVPAGDYRVALELTDEDLILSGPGRLLQREGSSVIHVARTLGDPVTVTSVTTVQLGISNPGASDRRTDTASRLNMAVAEEFANGDLLFLVSEDAYAYDAFSNGTFTYKAAYVPVHGLGLHVTSPANGGPVDGDTLEGDTSGATGLVQSVAAQDDGSKIVTFASCDGAFTDTETLSVAGQARGTCAGILFVIMTGHLLDTFTTSPVCYQVPTSSKLRIDVTIAAEGNVDQIGLDREPAIQLDHVADGRIKAFVESAYTRAIQLRGCYGCDVDAEVMKLPNNNADSAFGYGVEVFGCTEACRIKVIGRNLRHCFTTNITANSAFANISLATVGVPKHNLVHDSFAYNSISAGFDTHAGAYRTIFDNCHAVQIQSGYRALTGTAGFQNRSFGTVYRNCSAEGCIRGWLDLVGNYGTPPIYHTVRHENCAAIDYAYVGFDMDASDSHTEARHEYVECEAVGNGDATNTPYFQSGFKFKSTSLYMFNCRSRRFNGNPLWYIAAGGRVAIVDFFADFSEGPGTAGAVSGMRFNAAPTELAVIGYKCRLHTTANSTTGAFRVHGATVDMFTDGVRWINGSPQTYVSLTSGGVLNTTVVTPQTS